MGCTLALFVPSPSTGGLRHALDSPEAAWVVDLQGAGASLLSMPLPASGQLRRIGLTGGIATGKSTIAHLLAERRGIPVLDADRFAREALAPGAPATRVVIDRYGEVVCAGEDPTGQTTVDRAALAKIVFADPEERRWLEQLLHPLVRARFSEELRRLAGAPIVALMVPLLFEGGLEALCTEIWVVECGSEEEQLRRLQARDGLTRAEAQARMGAQWPMAAKLALADVVIHNSGPSADLWSQVESALQAAP